MTHLLEKNTPFVFSEYCIQAFQTLKKKLTEAPILIAPNWDLPFELMCDASDFAIGAVLGQRHEKHFKPIYYASKTMNDAETNYTTIEKEMLAVVPVHCVPKKGGFTVVENEENELIPTRLVTGWRVCIDYRKLNEATRKDHFPLLFMDQMLERLARNEFYCFLDGFSGYFQIPIDPRDQEKTTFTVHMAHLPIDECLSVCAMHRVLSKGVCWLFSMTWLRRRWKSLWKTSRSLGIPLKTASLI
nr:reverse transcriptase domain-containing protein [Tanacetum cinerariifolium]